MAFVVDALGSWLVEQVASRWARRLGERMLGSPLERALHEVGRTAIQEAAAQLAADDSEGFAMVVGEVFQVELPRADRVAADPIGADATLLEVLCAGIAARLAVLGDATVTGAGISSAQALGVPVELLARTLIGQVLGQIRLRALGGGPLEPLARQLNDDLTHLQLRDHARLGLRSTAVVLELVEQVRRLTEPTPPALLGWRQVVDCDPMALGVHPSITPTRSGRLLGGVPVPGLPVYVRRDGEEQVREAIRAAAERGGLVVLVGGSSTGKTRLAYQALAEELSSWRLYQPADSAALTAAVTSGQLPHAGAVIWLDEFQHFLADGLAVGTVRALLSQAQPMVLLATMWPNWYEEFTAPPPTDPALGERAVGDPWWDARQILTATSSHSIRVEDFTVAERRRARKLVNQDPRWAVALDDRDFGPTQVLAGAPQLVDRWEHATNPYAKAIITAAIDAHRLGHLDPLSVEFLGDAAPGYLTDRQRASASPDWLGSALAYATKDLRGATAALIPVPGAGVGAIDGYKVADYLLQHGQRAREWTPPPASLWESALAHTLSASDGLRLARAADQRGLYRHAVSLIAAAAEAGDSDAMQDLAGWLQRAGHVRQAELWRLRAVEAGNPWAMARLARRLDQEGRSDEAEVWWRRAADAGDAGAILELAQRLERIGRDGEAEEWWGRAAKVDDRFVLQMLAERLDRAQRFEEADHVWRRTIEVGDSRGDAGGIDTAVWRLERLGRSDEVEQIWQCRAETGDRYAMWALARLLEQAGRLEEAEAWWRRAAEPGDPYFAIGELVGLLERSGRSAEVEEVWREAAETGNRSAMSRLAKWLEGAGRLEEAEAWWRRAAEGGDPSTVGKLAELLERSGRSAEVEEAWRQAAATGYPYAMMDLAERLEQAGRSEEAGAWWRRNAQTGYPYVMMDLAERLERVERSEEAEEVRWKAAALGDRFVMERLAKWLEGVGRLEEAEATWRRVVQMDAIGAIDPLTKMLERAGRGNEAERLRRFGLDPGGRTSDPWDPPTPGDGQAKPT